MTATHNHAHTSVMLETAGGSGPAGQKSTLVVESLSSTNLIAGVDPFPLFVPLIGRHVIHGQVA